jgi:hypothetical protein
LVRLIRGKEGANEGEHQHERDDENAEDRHAVPDEAFEDDPPEADDLDLLLFDSG